jgi:hypothetical protein
MRSLARGRAIVAVCAYAPAAALANPSGVLHAGSGTPGVMTRAIVPLDDEAAAMAPHDDDRIVVAGRPRVGSVFPVHSDLGPDAVIKRLLLRRRNGGAVQVVRQTRHEAIAAPAEVLPTHAVIALAAPVAREGECAETSLAAGCARDGAGRLVCRQ